MMEGAMCDRANSVKLERASPSARVKMPVSLKHIQGLGQGKCLKEAKPFTRMPVVGQIEPVPADILQARERCLELGSD